MVRDHRSRAYVVLALVSLAGACADTPPTSDDPEPADEVTSEVPSPQVDPIDTATWSVGIVEAPATAAVPPLPVLTALRTATHSDWVRVVFELGGVPTGEFGSADRPGYHLEYVDRPLRACGSGEQIFPMGDGWLEVRLEPAAAHTEQGEATLGPREVPVDGPLLQRIYRTCDFEGIVTHVLALASPNPYRVVTLQDPLRIVVDVER